MNNSELNTCCLYTIAVQDNPIFTDKRLHCDSCKETLWYTGTRWQYEPFQGLCNSATCETEHAHDEPPAPRAGERERDELILESPSEAVERIRQSSPEWAKLDSSASEEWRTESRADFNGYVIVRTARGRPVAMGCRPEDAAQIITEHNQHAILIEQRERALEALKGVAIMLNIELEKYDSEPWAQRVRAAIATIEQEGEA